MGDRNEVACCAIPIHPDSKDTYIIDMPSSAVDVVDVGMLESSSPGVLKLKQR
jgi:hypothetical protein